MIAASTTWPGPPRRPSGSAPASAGLSALQIIESQRLWSAYLRGDTAELARKWPVIEYATGLPTRVPVWPMVAALAECQLERHEDAGRRLARRGRVDRQLHRCARGPLRIAALALAALVCAELAAAGRDVTDVARGLEASLTAHEAAGVMVGWPALYLGNKQRYIDLVARVAGRDTGSAHTSVRVRPWSST